MRTLRTTRGCVAVSCLALVVGSMSTACGKRAGAHAIDKDPPAEPAPAASAPATLASVAEAQAASAAPAVSANPCAIAPPSRETLIDDFEDADSEAVKTRDQNGSWFVASDGSRGGEIKPAAGPAIPERLEVPRCGSIFALHLAGGHFTQWGAILGLNPRFDKKPLPVDWSQLSGLRLWARAGANQIGVVRLNLDDTGTHPAGGKCRETPGAAHPCWNSFGVELTQLPSEWQELRIPFSSLTQKTPESAPVALDLTSVYQVAFKTSPGNSFDFWVDDIALYP